MDQQLQKDTKMIQVTRKALLRFMCPHQTNLTQPVIHFLFLKQAATCDWSTADLLIKS